jgi:hypothetical protein
VPYIGGNAHAMQIVKILENLSSVEEQTIRNKAVDAIKKILAGLKIKDVESEVMVMIKRLISNEGYTCKFSATYLIPPVFPHVNSAHQAELMQIFSQVTQDQIP